MTTEAKTNGNGTRTAEPIPVEKAMTPFEPRGLEEAMKLADTLARSSLLPEALRGKPGDVLVTLITGHELGLSSMQSIRGLHVIKGRAVMSADLMVALVQRNRDVCEYFRLVQSTADGATFETKRRGHPEAVRMSFTMEQARAAGLAGKDTWKSYPAAMLRARAASSLARAVYPDLCFGMYDDTEADEIRGTSYTAPPKPAEAIDAVFTNAPAGTSFEETQLSDVDRFKALIADASTLEDLTALVKDMRKLSRDDQKILLEPYNARKAELTPPPAQTEMLEPGSQDD